MDAEANRPMGAPLVWGQVSWSHVEGDVRTLRRRIFAAAKDADHRRVRNLQRLMLRSRANALVAVRRVTQVNAGRLTAGVDGLVVDDDETRAEMVGRLLSWPAVTEAMPVRRVYIPKADGRRRPLGIPVLMDRARQAMFLNALEPEWEARFEADSYGFRPGRGCHDAIEAIFIATNGASRRRWVLDADLKAAFDHIDHDHLLAMLEGFPAREQIRAWLVAGVFEDGVLTDTGEGAPQGGVISPLLLNIAVHGMEEAAGVLRCTEPSRYGWVRSGSPVLIRYADDFVALCHSREQAQTVKDSLSAWLAPRGLTFNADKTKIVALSEGFDFLGFTIRRHTNGKVLTTPSKSAVVRIRARLSAEVKALRGGNSADVVDRLNPIIRGWATYYAAGVSSQTFQKLDAHVFEIIYRWALRRHPSKPKKWVVHRYFGRFNKGRADRWVFGDRATGAYLSKFAWTPIRRHVKVKGRASPDDPALDEYWRRRWRRRPTTAANSLAKMIVAQHGQCPRCGTPFLDHTAPPGTPSAWEQWQRGLIVTARRTGAEDHSSDGPGNRYLQHAHCPVSTTPRQFVSAAVHGLA